jgi:uncharacterized membrane protein YqgA involved in biofilm formation
MIGLGTLVNVAVIIVGGLVGTLVRSAIKERFRDTVMQAIGLSVVLIGVSGAIQGIIGIASDGTLVRNDLLLMTLSLVFGGLVGEWIDIERRLDAFGMHVQSRLSGRGGSTFSEGFVTASLVYCVGAMAIVGALEDGLAGNPSTLFTKSVLDGVSAVVFASTLGIGVVFSALPVLLYQGAITLFASFIAPILPPDVVLQLSLVGGVLILAIGFNMLGFRRIKVGNLLPALLVPILWSLVA